MSISYANIVCRFRMQGFDFYRARSKFSTLSKFHFFMMDLGELKNEKFSEIAKFNKLHEHISFQTTCIFLEYDVLEHEK